jgi:hypothetical protein
MLALAPVAHRLSFFLSIRLRQSSNSGLSDGFSSFVEQIFSNAPSRSSLRPPRYQSWSFSSFVGSLFGCSRLSLGSNCIWVTTKKQIKSYSTVRGERDSKKSSCHAYYHVYSLSSTVKTVHFTHVRTVCMLAPEQYLRRKAAARRHQKVIRKAKNTKTQEERLSLEKSISK